MQDRQEIARRALQKHGAAEDEQRQQQKRAALEANPALAARPGLQNAPPSLRSNTSRSSAFQSMRRLFGS